MSDNEEIIAETLANFKILNKIEDTEQDDLYKLFISKAVQTILNLTNRIIFPLELQYVLLDMINEFYRDYLTKNADADSISNGNYIKQVSEEGRTVAFGNLNELELSSSLSALIDYQLALRNKEIYRYRLLYKVKGKNEQ